MRKLIISAMLFLIGAPALAQSPLTQQIKDLLKETGWQTHSFKVMKESLPKDAQIGNFVKQDLTYFLGRASDKRNTPEKKIVYVVSVEPVTGKENLYQGDVSSKFYDGPNSYPKEGETILVFQFSGTKK